MIRKEKNKLFLSVSSTPDREAGSGGAAVPRPPAYTPFGTPGGAPRPPAYPPFVTLGGAPPRAPPRVPIDVDVHEGIEWAPSPPPIVGGSSWSLAGL